MDKVLYSQVGNTFTIKAEGRLYTLSTSDLRYPQIKEAIESGATDDILSLVDPTRVLNKEGFVVKDGLVYFKDEPIPTILGNKFLEFKLSKVSFISLVNFWLNLKKRADFDSCKETIVSMLSKEAYPVTTDGFYVVYRDNYASQGVTSKLIPFFNYSGSYYASHFEKKMTLENIIVEVFGFNSKKLQKLVVQGLFVPGQSHLCDRVFHYGTAFKGLLSPNNLFTLMEKDVFKTLRTGSLEEFRLLNTFLSEFAKTKEGSISEKKILNLFDQPASMRDLADALTRYNELKKRSVTINIQADTLKNISDVAEYLKREIRKIENPEIELEIEKFFPVASKLDNVVIDNFKIVLPRTNYDLAEWSEIMSNCIRGYAQKVKSGQSLVMAVVDSSSNRMIYNIEISNRRIVQFSAKGNSAPNSNDENLIKKYLEKAGLVA